MKYDYSNGSRPRLIRNALHFGSFDSIGRGQEITERMRTYSFYAVLKSKGEKKLLKLEISSKFVISLQPRAEPFCVCFNCKLFSLN